jgi:hypothetical protein
MQLYDVSVRIGGNLNSVVPKQDVTAAEILVLRRLHGDDAVIDIRPTNMDKRSHGAEWARLVDIYGRNGSSSVDGASVVLESIFPGAVKTLPVKLDDIASSVAEPEEA